MFFALLLVAPFAPAAAAHTTSALDTLDRLRSWSCPPPVDDDNWSGYNSPWAEKPLCVVPESSQSRDKYCVYTLSHFNENSGISLITTPDSAASLVDAVQHPTAAWKARKHLHVAGRSPLHEHQLPYRVQNMPGKGKGVVAKRKIEQFAVFLESYPAIIADHVFFPPIHSDAPVEGASICAHAVRQLGDPDRVLSLAMSGNKSLSLIEDIIKTNSFSLILNGKPHIGVFPEISVGLAGHGVEMKRLTLYQRMNHGCNPK